MAAPITPSHTSFGTLPGATLGGNGIPNHSVAIFQSLGDLTLGWTAHQRFAGPDLANNGAGRFTAAAGVSPLPPSRANPFALWNFAFCIGGSDVSDLAFSILHDFDPAAGNDQSGHGARGRH